MPLNDIVGQAIEATRKNGRIVLHDAVEFAVPRIKADPEALDRVIRDGLSRQIKTQYTKEIDAVSKEQSGQSSLPFDRVRRAYALDLNGRELKETEHMVRIEWQRIRAIRRQQIVNDMAHLKDLDDADLLLAPLWDANPALTYGEVKALWILRKPAAVAAAE